jgi:ribosomal protein S6E (S10)
MMASWILASWTSGFRCRGDGSRRRRALVRINHINHVNVVMTADGCADRGHVIASGPS